MSTAESLTTHLVSLSTTRPYSAATEHPFLTAAGLGTLSPALLSLYLAQDRLYAAHGYPAFIGRVLASVPFSSLDAVDSPAEHRNQRIVQVLSYSLQNVVREIGFFGETADNWGLQLEGWKERKATRDYTAEMARIGAEGRIEDGLVFLWAMERARTFRGGITAAAVAALVSNWTNPEFVQFVDDLSDIVNSLDIKPGSPAWSRAESIWARVVELEEAFWPIAGEELAILGS